MALVGPDGQIHLSHKQAEVMRLLTDDIHTEGFFGGGAGSTKSTLGCLWHMLVRTKYERTRGLIGRETYPELRDSTMATFFQVAHEMNYQAGQDYEYNAQSETVTWNNGSETHFRYLQSKPSDPDFHRLGSTEYTDVFVDEAPGVSRRAVQVLQSRIRYRLQEHRLIPKMLLTGNPGPHWIKKEYVFHEDGSPVVLAPHRFCVLSTIADHPDEAFRKQYIKQLETLDQYDKARLLYGDWRVGIKPERPFAHLFDPERHVKPTIGNPHDIHEFAVDFNVDPFVCVHARIWSDAQGEHFHTRGEIVIKEASIAIMAERIAAVCPHRHLIRLTGDRNGMSRSIGTNGPTQLFEELRRHLGIGRNQVDLPANPAHILSREEVNFVLMYHPDFRVDPVCTKLITDLQVVSVDDKGSIVKGDRSKIEAQADALDCLRYLIHTRLREWIKRKRHELQQNSNRQPGQPVRGSNPSRWAHLAGL